MQPEGSAMELSREIAQMECSPERDFGHSLTQNVRPPEMRQETAPDQGFSLGL